MYLVTHNNNNKNNYDHDQQFCFKSKHATDMCIFTVKSIIKYYTEQNSPTATAMQCILDICYSTNVPQMEHTI